MIILAKSVKGHEFMYNARSARQVSARSADRIMQVLNEKRYLLKDDEVWHKHEVYNYENAYYYAQDQKFRIRKGIVSDCRC